MSDRHPLPFASLYREVDPDAWLFTRRRWTYQASVEDTSEVPCECYEAGLRRTLARREAQ